jgi:hypothetical protein
LASVGASGDGDDAVVLGGPFDRGGDEPRTTEHYDRARGNLHRHGVHFLTPYVAGV